MTVMGCAEMAVETARQSTPARILRWVFIVFMMRYLSFTNWNARQKTSGQVLLSEK
jgi:hypothetical protein